MKTEKKNEFSDAACQRERNENKHHVGLVRSEDEEGRKKARFPPFFFILRVPSPHHLSLPFVTHTIAYKKKKSLKKQRKQTSKQKCP